MKLKAMKKILYILLLTTAAAIHAQTNDAPVWKAVIKVVDDSGQPVNGAQVTVGYEIPTVLQGKIPDKIIGLTDANGIFTASHQGKTYGFSFLAEETGYYRNDLIINFHHEPKTEDLNQNQTLVLKKIDKPISMYAKSLNMGMPVFDKPVGYDFEIGDWVGPYGKGINADILFTGHFDKPTDSESDYTLTVSFPKTGDGIQEFTIPDGEKGSVLHSKHEAPADGYQPKWVQTDNRAPGKPIETNRDPNHNYYFRVQTKIDDRGNIVSAHYGKIYGDFMEFKYYLNPTPNDHNVEFNPKQNLITNLGEFEGVKAP
jgi:hypothetical protein